RQVIWQIGGRKNYHINHGKQIEAGSRVWLDFNLFQGCMLSPFINNIQSIEVLFNGKNPLKNGMDFTMKAVVFSISRGTFTSRRFDNPSLISDNIIKSY
ncbi:MAG: hypothetical protein ACTSXU_15825, partial [Promethearchaeota archaeon]